MLVILAPNTDENAKEYQKTWEFLSTLPNVQLRKHIVRGMQQRLTEIYLIGDTTRIDSEQIAALPTVERVIRISESYRILGRHKDSQRAVGFEYNGVHFSQDNLNVFAGLCAVDLREHTEQMMKALQENGQQWLENATRAGKDGIAESGAEIENLLKAKNWQELATLPAQAFWRQFQYHVGGAQALTQVAIKNQTTFTQGLQIAGQERECSYFVRPEISHQNFLKIVFV